MSGTGFSIDAADGSPIFEFAWRDAAEPAVEALTEAFGTAPELSVHPGDGTHFPDYTQYDWRGFTLYDMVVTADGKARSEYATPTWASIRTNEIAGIPIVAEFGLAIGSTVDAVRGSRRGIGPDRAW